MFQDKVVGRFHHRREYLHRWRSDETYDLSQRLRLELSALIGGH